MATRKAVKRSGGAARQLAVQGRHPDIFANRCGDRLAIAPRVAGIDQSGRHCLQHVPQFLVVGADHRVRRRDRGVGNAHVDAGQRDHRVLEVVFAQDGHRALGVQTQVEQVLADAAGRLQGLRVADVVPVAGAPVGVAHTACHPGALGHGGGPVQQPVGDAPGVWLDGLFSAQVAHAGRPLAQLHPGHAKAQRPVTDGLRAAHVFCTLAALPSRKARTRSLASGALWAMPAIMDSVKKP